MGSANPTDLLVVKYDPQGNQLWENRYGFLNSYTNVWMEMDASYNLYIICGNGIGLSVKKIDPSGGVVWTSGYIYSDPSTNY